MRQKWFWALALSLAFVATTAAWPSDREEDPLRPTRRRFNHNQDQQPDQEQDLDMEQDSQDQRVQQARRSNSPEVLFVDPEIEEARYARERQEYLEQEGEDYHDDDGYDPYASNPYVGRNSPSVRNNLFYPSSSSSSSSSDDEIEFLEELSGAESKERWLARRRQQRERDRLHRTRRRGSSARKNPYPRRNAEAAARQDYYQFLREHRGDHQQQQQQQQQHPEPLHIRAGPRQLHIRADGGPGSSQMHEGNQENVGGQDRHSTMHYAVPGSSRSTGRAAHMDHAAAHMAAEALPTSGRSRSPSRQETSGLHDWRASRATGRRSDRRPYPAPSAAAGSAQQLEQQQRAGTAGFGSSVPQYLRSSPAREQNRSPSPARASGYRQRHSPDLDRNRGGYHSHDAGRSAGMRGTLASQQGRSSPQRGRGGRVGGARGQQPTSPLASRYAVGTVRSPQHASRAVALRSPTARRGGIGSRSWRRSPSPPARGGRSNRRGSGSRGGRIGKRRGRGGRKG